MEYINFENDKVVKYDVSWDAEKLLVLYKEIVVRCGVREHKSYSTDYLPRIPQLLMENYKEKVIGKKEYFEETRTFYHLEYNLIKEPSLAILIRQFLDNENHELLSALLSEEKIIENNDQSEIDAKELLGQLAEKLNSNSDHFEVKKITSQINEVDYNIKLNKSLNLLNQSDYIPKVKELFDFAIVDEIDLETYNRVIGFKNKIMTLKS